MDIAVIISLQDKASINIKEHLLLNGFEKTGLFKNQAIYELSMKQHKIAIYTIETNSVHVENLDKEISADTFVFATKHQSRAGIHSFSVHPIGNWGVADFGGKNRTLSPSPAALMKECFLALTENNPGMHQVIQEATHHGPFIEKPVMFIEIGSSLDEWQKPLNGKVIATSLLQAIEAPAKKYTSAIGIGGLHHTPNFKKLMMGEDIAVSHICPKHMLTHLDNEMIIQALAKSDVPAKLAILDWKGLGPEKARIKEMVEQAGIEAMRV